MPARCFLRVTPNRKPIAYGLGMSLDTAIRSTPAPKPT